MGSYRPYPWQSGAKAELVCRPDGMCFKVGGDTPKGAFQQIKIDVTKDGRPDKVFCPLGVTLSECEGLIEAVGGAEGRDPLELSRELEHARDLLTTPRIPGWLLVGGAAAAAWWLARGRR